MTQAALSPEPLLALDKAALFTLTPALHKAQRSPAPAYTAPAVLDNEWVPYAKVPVALTPEPYEDLDQPFVHQHWTVEVNTTRRSDHASKYKVTWGPLAAIKANASKPAALNAQALAGSTGPAAATLLPTRLAQALALYNVSVLPYKTSSGLAQWVPSSTLGALASHPALGLLLTQALAPESADVTGAPKLVSSLRHKTPCLAKVAPFSSQWVRLWRFHTGVSDLHTLTTHPHLSVHPSAWLTKALLVTSLRLELLERGSVAGARRPLSLEQAAVGSQNNLLLDLTLLASLAGRGGEPKPLTTSAWRTLTGQGASWVAQALDADLTARAGYALINEEVGSIRRLRVTKGVYLPSDVPMHAVCGSKDVIHSWAIPGLNIKIDCIPGYNSHRRVFIRWRGAY